MSRDAQRRVAPVAVPFNQPYVTGAELGYIQDAIDNAHLSGNGPFTERCTARLAELLGAPAVLLTHSCTGALEMAAMLSEVGTGDEVIMPSFTFSSTATAFALRGATPVFVDIRPDTLNLDERLVESAITERTRAIVPVHYAGVACAMPELNAIAARHGLMVIEDAAQAFGSTSDARTLGTYGSLGAISFHETKNVISGEGGALIVNDPGLVRRAEIIHEKGTDRRAFFRGDVDKYSWVDLGSSFVPSELTAAFLWAQLQRGEWIMTQRRALWSRYHEALRVLEDQGSLRRPVIPAGSVHNAHLYYILLASAEQRDRVLSSMSRDGVAAVFHYVPLHSSVAGRRYGRPAGQLDVTDRTSATLVRLPLWVGMSDAQFEQVVHSICSAVR